jgi:hypothetical protein
MAAMIRPGREFTLWTVAVGVLALVVASIAAKDWIREEYWMWKLRTGDTGVQRVAAQNLDVLRSVRAVPLLVKSVLKLADRSGNNDSLDQRLALINIGQPAVLELFKAWRDNDDDLCKEACFQTLFDLFGRPEKAITGSDEEGRAIDTDQFLALILDHYDQPAEVRQVVAEIIKQRRGDWEEN